MIISRFIAVFILCFQLAFGNGFTPIEDQAKLAILTPSFANRQTLKIRLDNGLEAYIVSDPQIDKSSAGLTVKTGSWEDPKDYPGTAHFLEHMLFLGTKKFPNESEYDRYITEHGGLSNAFTSSDQTSFVFIVDNNGLPEALDRFSSFFKEPLFNPSGVARELQAIDQEYAQNLESDDIREYYVWKELTDVAHPNHAFGMGNSQSLQKVSQDTLKDWYGKHYSANRMRLIVIGNLPIEKLRDMVVASFGPIPNRNFPPFDLRIPMFPDTVKGHMINIEPGKNIRKLTLLWELPPQFADMRDTKPEQIICYVMGHEGGNSLLAELKKAKYADALGCGSEVIGGHNLLFVIEIQLTNSGVKNVDTVILRTFEALANFRKTGPSPYLFDDLHKMSVIDYQYQPKEDAFENILKQVSWIAKENLETYPEQSQVIHKFDPVATQELLDFLTPKNCIYSLTAPATLTGVTPDRQEKWLGTEYSLQAIPQQTMSEWEQASPNPRIELPEPNLLIPEKLTIINNLVMATADPEYAQIPHPIKLIDDEKALVYFAPDTHYASPKVSLILEIKTPVIQASSVESIVLGDIFVKHAMEAMSPYTYPATMAGLDFDISRTDNGLKITIDGYSDKAEILFLDLITTLKELRPREQQFKIYKELLSREYQNASLDKPLFQIYDYLKSVIYKEYPTQQAKLQAIKKVNFEQFEEFSSAIFNKTFVEGMLYGNMSEAQAKHMSSELLESLESEPYPKQEQPKKAVIVMPKDAGPFFVECKTKALGNAAILAIELDPFSFKLRAAQQILMQAMREPFFSNLRTKQQTGYIVISRAEEYEKHLFNIFAVQSNTHEGRDLLARFELFIESFMQEISKSEVSEARFNNIKDALVNELRQPPKNISEMGSLLNRLAFYYNGDFNWIEKRIQGFNELTYNEFLDIAKGSMGKQNKRRLGILLTGNIPTETTINYKKINGINQLRKLGVYQE